MLYTRVRHTHTGWMPDEVERLFLLAAEAQAGGRPLKAVFDEIAASTGRRPNSVRNFYYARIKTEDGARYSHKRAFTPFSDEESEKLVEQVLLAQAAGESVRSCTLRLAEGDDKRMLRYQNKYRALLKSDPALIRRVAEGLTAAGKPAFDPFSVPQGKRRPGRPHKSTPDIERTAGRIVNDLSRVEGLDVAALLDALGALTVAAIRGSRTHGEKKRADDSLIGEENASLRQALEASRARCLELTENLRQLMRINSEFLSLNSGVKVNHLTNYLRDLETNVRDCERAVVSAE